jgi:hypothetical protein
MTTKQKFQKGDKAFIAPNVRPTYIQGVEVEVLGFRRGRYDVKIADNPKARRFAGAETRCEESWLVEKPGKTAPKAAKQEPVKKFKAGDVVKIKEGVRPSYLPGAVVEIVADRRGKYDVQMPTDPSLSRFSGVEARFPYTAVEETDESFEPATDGTVKVWATLVPEKGVITKKQPGDVYEIFKTEAQARSEAAEDLMNTMKVEQIELPAMMPVIVWGSEGQFLEAWFMTAEERDAALTEKPDSGLSYKAAEWPTSKVLAHEKQLRDEHKAEMRAEGMMS